MCKRTFTKTNARKPARFSYGSMLDSEYMRIHKLTLRRSCSTKGQLLLVNFLVCTIPLKDQNMKNFKIILSEIIGTIENIILFAPFFVVAFISKIFHLVDFFDRRVDEDLP